MSKPETPMLTVDVIVVNNKGEILLIERGGEPFGWALPGGCVEIGERLEHAATREIKEETRLYIGDLTYLGHYDDPSRDPRGHAVSFVYVAKVTGEMASQAQAGDDAVNHRWVQPNETGPLCFDHNNIVADYLLKR